MSLHSGLWQVPHLFRQKMLRLPQQDMGMSYNLWAQSVFGDEHLFISHFGSHKDP